MKGACYRVLRHLYNARVKTVTVNANSGGSLVDAKVGLEKMTLQVELKVSRSSRELAPNPDMQWIERNYKRLQARYADKWVAVKNSQVVEFDTELEPLLAKLTKKHGTTLGFAVEFIGSGPRNLLI